ncbi:DUF4153 domain-containing protein [Sphingomonas sp.]|uniref:DUF4153 domain-containing protein n=1 Tax=Sphingomonas sp. TaxID=28214 RepID=UPI0025F9D324|nr:DUF4153 domain-containing protein [Sphingomonas sp.]
MTERFDSEDRDWPARPWIMALAGAVGGLIVHFLTDRAHYGDPFPVWRQAATAFTVIATVSFILTVELRRWSWAIAFALGWGAVIALVGWFTAQYNQVPEIFEFPFFSGILAVLIAAPLFQTIRDEGAWRFPYARLHRHAWTDAVIGAAALLFTGITFLLAWLIASLFDVIGIDAIKELLKKEWFGWMLAGFAFGGAIGVLRERDALVATLQKLVTVILAVLAPVLAVALAAFLLSIPFTGLQGLWKSDIPATPMLLLSAAGAFVFLNDVIGDGGEERRPNIWLRRSALILAICILPLAFFAALSMGQRVGQYGWTPERIWGAIAVAVAMAYGLAGWWAVFKGRQDFDDPLRPLQTRLAIGLCGLALFLALPIGDFGAISANSQLARLASGKVSPTEFDWAAMAFDFGPAGRKHLEAIARSGPVSQRKLASTALKSDSRWELTEDNIVAGPQPEELVVVPKDAEVPADLREQLLGKPGTEGFCSSGGACRVFPQDGGKVFIVVMDGCANLPPAERNDPKQHCMRNPAVFERDVTTWVNVYEGRKRVEPSMTKTEEAASLQRESDALERGDVKIAPVSQRQLVIGGKPSGNVFE